MERAARRSIAPVRIGAVLLALAGCGSPQPLSADAAVETYDALASDLQSALAPQGVVWHRAAATRKVAERDGACAYDPGNWLPETSAESHLRTPRGWEPWLSAIDPVLEDHGFARVSVPEQVEGVLRIRTTDDHGAELTLDMTGQLRIWNARIDASPCAAETLGL